MSDYLFDKAGTPDAEIESLETQLQPLKYRRPPPRLPRRRRLWIPAVSVAMAAAAVIAIVGWRPAPATGEWLETGARRMTLQIGEIGTVELSPQTRARVVSARAPHRLELARGKLAARIQAPPRQLVIETPRARVVDLGCVFEITVDESGRGRLLVSEGAVALSSDGGPEITVRAGSEHDLVEPPIENKAPPPVDAPAPVEAPARPKPGPKLKVKAPKAAAPSKDAVPVKKIEPAKRDEGIKLHHDSLRDLERSVH